LVCHLSLVKKVFTAVCCGKEVDLNEQFFIFCTSVCVCVYSLVGFVLGLYEHAKKNKVYSRDSGFLSFFLFPVAIFISVP
jgi:hypothetical protein